MLGGDVGKMWLGGTVRTDTNLSAPSQKLGILTAIDLRVGGVPYVTQTGIFRVVPSPTYSQSHLHVSYSHTLGIL